MSEVLILFREYSCDMVVSIRVEGIVVPLITPFKENLSIDYEALKWLLERLSISGIHAVFPSSTTGEFPHLTLNEMKSLNEFTVEQVSNRVKVYVGVTANCTTHVIELARHAQDIGADGIIATTPYYFKHNVKALKDHYSRIAESVDISIIIYNIPSTTGILISIGLIVELAKEYSNIVATKITHDSLSYFIQLIEKVKAVRKNFSVLTGNGYLLLPILTIGGDGAVVAIANAYPKTCVEVYRKWVENDVVNAIRSYRKLLELSKLYFIHNNIGATIKMLLSLAKTPIKPIVRPPLTPPKNIEEIRNILKKYPIELR